MASIPLLATDIEPPFILLLGHPQEGGSSLSSSVICISPSRKEKGGTGKGPSLPTKNTSWKLHDFHSHPVGWRLVAWLHLALREGRKCSLYAWHLFMRPADIWMFYF